MVSDGGPAYLVRHHAERGLVGLHHQVLADEIGGIGEPVRVLGVGGGEQQARGFDGVAGHHHILGALEPPAPFPDVVNAGGAAVLVGLDASHHRQVANFGTRLDRLGNKGDQLALLGVGGAAEAAKAAIDAGLRLAVRRRNGGERGRRPVDAQGLAAPRQKIARAVDLVGAVGVGAAFGAPGIAGGAGDAERPLGLGVPAPHLAPVQRPVRAVAEHALRLEPLGPEPQRDHGKVDRRAAYRLAAVLAAHCQGIGAVDDAVIGPIKLVLFGLVGGEVLQRTKIGTGVEADHRETRLRQTRDHGAAAGAGADHHEIDCFVLVVFPHRQPGAGAHHIRGAAAGGARGGEGVSGHGRCPAAPPWATSSTAC